MLRLRGSANSQTEVRQFVNKLSRLTITSDGIERVAAVCRQGFLANFASQTSFAGVPWAPLAPRTVRDRISLGFPGARPILVRTGAYRQSFGMRTHPEHVSEVERTRPGHVRLYVGSGMIRVGTLELGHGPFGVPPRPAMGLNTMYTDRLGEILDNEFERALD